MSWQIIFDADYPVEYVYYKVSGIFKPSSSSVKLLPHVSYVPRCSR